MKSRKEIAGLLREDDIRYLKSLAVGRQAWNHTEEIIEEYSLSWKDVYGPSIIAFVVGIILLLAPTEGEGPAYAEIISACVLFWNLWLIADYRAAEIEFPSINEVLASRSQVSPIPGIIPSAILTLLFGLPLLIPYLLF